MLKYLIVILLITNSSLAQNKKKKASSLLKKPRKDKRYKHLKGKNQNNIVLKYSLSNLVSGEGYNHNNGRFLKKLERNFVKTEAYQQKIQYWSTHQRTLMSSDVIEEHKNIWNFNESLESKDFSNENCEEVCPKSLDILRIQASQLTRGSDFFMHFRNREADMMSSYKRLYGYCWGHVALSSNLKMFAFFDPQNHYKQNVPKNVEEMKFFYKRLITRIANNKATIIPYFHNMRHFTAHPWLKPYFKDAMAKKWGRLAVRKKNEDLIKRLYRTTDTYQKLEKLFYTLQMKVASHQIPRLNFHRYGSRAYSHVVSVVGIEKFKNGRYKIYVDDPNEFPEEAPLRSKYIEIKKTPYERSGVQIYASYNFYDSAKHPRSHWKNHIGKIEILEEGIKFTEHSVKELYKFCIQKSNCRRK